MYTLLAYGPKSLESQARVALKRAGVAVDKSTDHSRRLPVETGQSVLRCHAEHPDAAADAVRTLPWEVVMWWMEAN